MALDCACATKLHRDQRKSGSVVTSSYRTFWLFWAVGLLRPARFTLSDLPGSDGFVRSDVFMESDVFVRSEVFAGSNIFAGSDVFVAADVIMGADNRLGSDGRAVADGRLDNEDVGHSRALPLVI